MEDALRERRGRGEEERRGGQQQGREPAERRGQKPAWIPPCAGMTGGGRGNDGEGRMAGVVRVGVRRARHSRESGNPHRPARRRHCPTRASRATARGGPRRGYAGGREGGAPRRDCADARPCAPPACRCRLCRLYLAGGGGSRMRTAGRAARRRRRRRAWTRSRARGARGPEPTAPQRVAFRSMTGSRRFVRERSAVRLIGSIYPHRRPCSTAPVRSASGDRALLLASSLGRG